MVRLKSVGGQASTGTDRLRVGISYGGGEEELTLKEEIFGVASFRSRQQVLQMEAALRRMRAFPVSVVTTPRDVSRWDAGCRCGLNWRMPADGAGCLSSHAPGQPDRLLSRGARRGRSHVHCRPRHHEPLSAGAKKGAKGRKSLFFRKNPCNFRGSMIKYQLLICAA